MYFFYTVILLFQINAAVPVMFSIISAVLKMPVILLRPVLERTEICNVPPLTLTELLVISIDDSSRKFISTFAVHKGSFQREWDVRTDAASVPQSK